MHVGFEVGRRFASGARLILYFGAVVVVLVSVVVLVLFVAGLVVLFVSGLLVLVSVVVLVLFGAELVVLFVAGGLLGHPSSFLLGAYLLPGPGTEQTPGIPLRVRVWTGVARDREQRLWLPPSLRRWRPPKGHLAGLSSMPRRVSRPATVGAKNGAEGHDRRMASLERAERITLLIAVLATAGAGAAHFAGAPSVLAFVVAGVALAALASIVSFATEQVGERFGPAVTGVLQSTLGNLPEFFIVLFALGAGHVVVAQTSVVGSLFANALLVLGAVIIVGSRRDGMMRFRPRLPQDTATLLLSASFVITLVALAVASHTEASRHVDSLSAIAAVCLLAIYGAWLWGYLRSDEPREEALETSGRAQSAAGDRRHRRGIRFRLVRERARAGDPIAGHL